MKREIKICLFTFSCFGVVVCSITKEDQLNKSGATRTQIIESIHDINEPSKDFTSNTSPEEISEVFNNDLRNSLLKKFLTKLRGVDTNVYGDMEKDSMHYDNGYRMLRSKSQLPMETSELMNRNLYPKLYAVRPLPAMDNLPPVYLSEPHAKFMYHEDIEPYNYNPELRKSLNPILIPVNLKQQRTSSEEDFWAHLSEDAIMKNIIPTMEVPMPHHAYAKYKQIFRAPVPLSTSEYMSNNPAEFYSENNFRDCTY